MIRILSTAGLTIITLSRIFWIEHLNAALDLLRCVHRQDFQMQSYLVSVQFNWCKESKAEYETFFSISAAIWDAD